MTAITTVLAFFVTVSVLIVFHEYGHYRVARACGVKVLRFSVGMGRVLWRHQRTPDSTEFVLSALPFGGYVTMLGRGMEVAPAERQMSFEHKPLWQRAAIIAAGPGANFLLAIALFAAVHWVGIDEPKAVMGQPVAASVADKAGLHAGDWAHEWSGDGGLEWHAVRSLSDLRWQINRAVERGEPLQLAVSDRAGRGRRVVTLALDALGGQEIDARLMQRIGLGEAYSDPVLGEVRAGEPADRAGLKSGDRVIAIDGVPIQDASAVYQAIRATGKSGQAQPMQWRVMRGGRTLDLDVVPNVVVEGQQKVGRVGVRPGLAPEMVNVRYGLFDGLGEAAVQTWQMAALNFKMLGKMVIGEASVKNLSGPLTIADYAGQSARLGLGYYLGFLAVVSVGLGVLNLLPLPVLDGGHLVYYLFEAVTGRPVSDAWVDRLQNAGVAIVILVMSLALYNDVTRFLGPQ